MCHFINYIHQILVAGLETDINEVRANLNGTENVIIVKLQDSEKVRP